MFDNTTNIYHGYYRELARKLRDNGFESFRSPGYLARVPSERKKGHVLFVPDQTKTCLVEFFCHRDDYQRIRQIVTEFSDQHPSTIRFASTRVHQNFINNPLR